ncbi:MAG: response regulator [Desulfobacteraceae bacterium]|nr:response regulator [Desulfobacteraceae bacterium]
MGLKEDKLKVLIIDDEIQMRFYLKTLVSSLGLDPLLAKDGVQGLKMLKDVTPSVIILDVMMPEKGGALVYQELVNNPELKSIPLVFFSGVDRNAFFHYIKMLNVSLEHDIPEPRIYVAKDADPEYIKEVIKTCISKNTGE